MLGQIINLILELRVYSMANNVTRQIQLVLNQSLAKKMQSIDLKAFGKDMNELLIKNMIVRTQAGVDVQGRKFGGYNKNYDKKQSLKYAKKRYGSTKYASSSISDKLQLTGNLFSSFRSNTKGVRKTKNGALIVFKMSIEGKNNNDKAAGLQSNTGYARNRKNYAKKAWDFFGIAQSGVYKKKETRSFFKLFNKYLEKSSSDKFKVIQSNTKRLKI